MAMIDCPNCRKPISAEATACPSCGHPFPPKPKGLSTGAKWGIGCIIAVVATPVLLGVLGIIAAIAIPAFVNARGAASGAACANNMAQIYAAKTQWAVEYEHADGDAIDDAAVTALLPGPMTCPGGGAYTYGTVGEEPTCSRHGTRTDIESQRSSSQ
jgi:hypothetical protein